MLTKQPHRPFCINCKTTLAKANGISKHGFKKWHKYCTECAKTLYNPAFKYLQHKRSRCDTCGFVAADKCQLDIVYKDNNKDNKSISNIKTVCANCNRLRKKQLKQKTILDITVDADVTIG
jgi:hypothetical protein